MLNQQDIIDLLQQVLDHGSRLGLTATEAVYRASDHSGVEYAHGAIENAVIAQDASLGIRLIAGKQQGFAKVGLPSNRAIGDLVEDLFQRVTVLPEDITCGLADRQQFYQGGSTVDVRDMTLWSRTEMTTMAESLWHGVMGYKGVDHSSGASVQQSQNQTVFMNDAGFFGDYQESRFQRSVSAIAGKSEKMEEDYSGQTRLYADDLLSVTDMVQDASARAVARNNPQKVTAGLAEVIFEPRVAARLVGQILSAINGAQIVRGASFLSDKIGQDIVHKEFSLDDDPFRYRCFSAAPFDAEGLPKQIHSHFKLGKLNKYILDLASSRGLNMAPQGQAIRSDLATPPSAGLAHAVVANGSQSVEDMIQNIGYGLWITEMIGQGLDIVTGKFSCGVAGFLIEGGQRTTPFRNVTIAGDGLTILQNLRPAKDQQAIGAMELPSLYLGSLTVGS